MFTHRISCPPFVASCMLVALACASSPGLVAHRDPQEQEEQPVKLTVKLSALKSAITSGESLQLRVEIWNEGPKDVFICKDFEIPGWPFCSLTLFLEDSSGQYRSQFGLAADFAPGTKVTMAKVLLRDWIALRPGHFYGATVSMDPDSYPRLRRTGIYKIIGRYASPGLVEGYFGTLSTNSEEIAHLPAKSWKGAIESSPIVVHVTPKKN